MHSEYGDIRGEFVSRLMCDMHFNEVTIKFKDDPEEYRVWDISTRSLNMFAQTAKMLIDLIGSSGLSQNELQEIVEENNHNLHQVTRFIRGRQQAEVWRVKIIQTGDPRQNIDDVPEEIEEVTQKTYSSLTDATSAIESALDEFWNKMTKNGNPYKLLWSLQTRDGGRARGEYPSLNVIFDVGRRQ